jgi:hypothetical protein
MRQGQLDGLEIARVFGVKVGEIGFGKISSGERVVEALKGKGRGRRRVRARAAGSQKKGGSRKLE